MSGVQEGGLRPVAELASCGVFQNHSGTLSCNVLVLYGYLSSLSVDSLSVGRCISVRIDLCVAKRKEGREGGRNGDKEERRKE